MAAGSEKFAFARFPGGACASATSGRRLRVVDVALVHSEVVYIGGIGKTTTVFDCADHRRST